MTRFIEILISLAIVAALYLAVALVLPSQRHLSEKTETNRKITIVFDSLNSLRRFKAWNPLVLRDPRVQLNFSGPDSGVGARLDYVSQNEQRRWFTVSFERSYKDRDGAWKYSKSFDNASLGKIIALCQQASEIIADLERESDLSKQA